MNFNTDPQQFTVALNFFLAGVNAKMQAYWASRKFTHCACPVIKEHNQGQRYIRLGIFEKWDSQPERCSGVYCFVDKTNGDLLKGSWKAPVKHGVRGNIGEAGTLAKFTHYGPAYLRG